MTMYVRKSVKKGKKMMEKATHLVFKALSNFFFVLANLKDINGYNRIDFFPLVDVNASFLNLLTRANNYRKFLCHFLAKKVTWHCPLA